jgi:hypothetical protein
VEYGKLITAKHNEDGSSSGGGLLNGKLGETKENVKISQESSASKAAGTSRSLKCKYVIQLC